MPVSQGTIDTIYTEILEAAGGAISATGTITFSTSPPTAATRATGTITLSDQPANNDTVTINGTVVTWKTSGATGNQVNIGGTQADSVIALHAFLAASADAEISKFTWTTNSTTTVTATAKVWGTAGNSLTLAESGTNTAVSGGTLSGGTAGDSVTINGVALQFIPAAQTSPTATDVAIGADVGTTGSLLRAYLNASANTSIDDATYTDNGAGVVTVTHDTPGTGGNSFTLAKSGTNIAVSGATLSGGAATGPIGRLNPVGAGTGEVLAVRANQTFEDNCLAVMAFVEFVISSSANPTTSNSTLVQSKQQRKMLKDVLQALSSEINVKPSQTSDTRVADAALVRKAGISEFNRVTRPAV